MLGLLKSLFGNSKKEMIKELLSNGATVIDVRSPGEFNSGHYKGSKNIPLDQIGNKINDIKKISGPIVLCCASGMRSGSATSILKSKGFTDVHNGGSWRSL